MRSISMLLTLSALLLSLCSGGEAFGQNKQAKSGSNGSASSAARPPAKSGPAFSNPLNTAQPGALGGDGSILRQVQEKGVPGDGSLLKKLQQNMRSKGFEPGSGAILNELQKSSPSGAPGGKAGAGGTRLVPGDGSVLRELKQQGKLKGDGSALKEFLSREQGAGKTKAANQKKSPSGSAERK